MDTSITLGSSYIIIHINIHDTLWYDYFKHDVREMKDMYKYTGIEVRICLGTGGP